MGCYCQTRWSAVRTAAWTTLWSLAAWGRVTVSVSSLPASFVYALKQTAFLTLFLDREWTSLPATVHGQQFLRMQWDLEIIFPINVGILRILSVLTLRRVAPLWVHECDSQVVSRGSVSQASSPSSGSCLLPTSSTVLSLLGGGATHKDAQFRGGHWFLIFHALVSYASLHFDCCPLTKETSLTKTESNPGLFVRF